MNYFVSASRIWTIHSPEDTLKYVRVKAGTSYITNKQVLLKKRCDAPDGLYKIDITGSLVPATIPTSKQWFWYPDVELFPKYPNAVTLCTIPQAKVLEIISMCQLISDESREVIIGKNGLYRSHCDIERTSAPAVLFDFGVTQEIRINAKYLEVALTSYMEYPVIGILREMDPIDSKGVKTPLIIGVDGGTCAYVSPSDTRYY